MHTFVPLICALAVVLAAPLALAHEPAPDSGAPTPAAPVAPAAAVAADPTPVAAAADATPLADLHPVVEVPAPVPAVSTLPTGPTASPWRFHSEIEQRFVGEKTSLVEALGPLPTELTRLGPTGGLEARSRAGFDLSFVSSGRWMRKAQVEVLAQMRYWDLPRAPLDASQLSLLRAKAELTTLAGQFTLGRTASQWGLGVLATDGGYDPMQFGAKMGENAVTRLGWAILPAALFTADDPYTAFPLAIAVAYDQVARDDLAPFAGDRATNLIGALLYRGTELQAGAYVVRRNQTDPAALDLQATVTDGFVRYRKTARHGWVEFAAEGVYAKGHTAWLKSPAQPDGLDIAQWGGIARVEIGRRRGALRLEAGAASADALPLNGTLRSFRFAADHHVGLVLFGQVQRQLSVQAQHNLSDPRFSGQGPAGVERVPTLGAVTQATYLHPVVRVQPYKNVAILLGGVWAQSPADVADPFRSFLNGGKATGPRGAVGKRDLGMELDAAIECSAHFLAGLVAVARVDAGVWFPGDAFDDAHGQPMAAVGALQAQVQIRTDF